MMPAALARAVFSAAIFSSVVSRRGPSSCVDAVERRDLALEAALVDGAERPPVRLEGELLHLLAGDAPLLARSSRRRGTGEISCVAVALDPALGPRTGSAKPDCQPAMHRRARSGSCSCSARRRRRRGPAVPDSTAWAAKCTACCEEPHWRSMVTPGDVFGQPGRQPAGAGDVAGLRADRVDAAEDHVLDRGRVDAGAVDQRLAATCAPRSAGWTVRRPPLLPADRGADRFDDVGLGHSASCKPSNIRSLPSRV